MKRRTVLVGLSTILGGCAGKDTAGDSSPTLTPTSEPTSTPSPTSTPTQTPSPTAARPQQAEEKINTAQKRLREAVSAYNNQIGTLYSPSRELTFSTDSIEVHLSVVDESLASAKPLATEEQLQQIEHLRRYYNYIRKLVSGLNSHAAATASFETGRDEFSNGAYQTAAGTFQTSLDHVEDAQSGVESARSTLSELEDSSLNREEVAYSEARSALKSLSEWFETMVALLNGYEAHSLGLARFNHASEFYNEEHYDAAKGTFELAVEYLSDATEAYPKPESTNDQGMTVYYYDLQCRSGGDFDAAKHMVKACEEIMAGNTEKGNEQVAEANSALYKEC